MVFQVDPGASVVIPMTIWQVGRTPGWMYWRRIRLLASSALPRSSRVASSGRTMRLGWAWWAGAEIRKKRPPRENVTGPEPIDR